MKTGKKILLTALSATLLASMTTGLALTAFADEATKDHKYDVKKDAVFEDFDRADVSDTVKAESGVDLGEKPYLHVEYEALTSASSYDDRNSQIYKQGSGSFGEFVGVSAITLWMRAPKGDVTLSELNFAVRGIDNEATVLPKDFTALVDLEEESLPELTTDWQKYEINLSSSFNKTDTYLDAAHTPVKEGTLMGFHIFADEGETGTIDIQSVSYTKTSEGMLNDFTGGSDIEATAKAVQGKNFWWNGSSTGYIVKRAAKMTGGSFTVVKEESVGSYAYAVIEAEGDVENLQVATTTDGTTWGDSAAYDGYSVTLTGEEKGFKFTYTGSEENGVTVKRIYLTNNINAAPATAVPVIDAKTADVLEDFSVAQNGFTGVWEDMSTAPELALAGLEYRLSYSNGDMVEVKDGSLVFDGTNLGEDGFINFKFKSKSASYGKFVVLKVKAEGGASMSGFRFALGNPEDALGDVIYAHQMMAAFDYPTAFLDASNPYKDGDWYYVVIDLEESGFTTFENGYSIMDTYYSGAGKLYIDSVFFANEVDKVPTDCVKTVLNEAGDAPFALNFEATNEGYQYGCEVKGLDGTPDFYNVLALEIEIEEGTDLSGVRFAGAFGERWAGGFGNHDGYLYLTDGTLLANAGFVAGEAKTVYIDLEKSEMTIGNFHIHTNGTGTGSFKINGAELMYLTSVSELKVPDVANAVAVKNEAGDADLSIDFKATSEDYQYICEVKGLDDLEEAYDLLALEIEIEEGTDLSGVRFAFGCGERWAGDFGNHDGYLYLTDGTLLADAGFVAGEAKTVYIDLAKSNITLSNFHIHTNGTGTGSFKITSAKLMKFTAAPEVKEAQEEQLALIPYYLDTVDPEVSITTATEAKAGKEITVTYTASDNVTEADKLEVVIEVTKDGSPVTLNGNKFTAEEGVYTVTVTVRDIAGNEAVDTVQITVSAASNGLSTVAIVGIVIGCIAVVAIAGATINFFLKKKKNN